MWSIPTDSNLFALPDGLPRPEDDGAADHLRGTRVPHLALRSTAGRSVDLATVAEHPVVVFLYPATIRPPATIPGEWSAVPGARGCTIQNAGYRDLYPEFRRLGAHVFGVSGQGQTDPARGLAEQMELVERLHLPFELLNDSRFELVRALGLPTFIARLKEPVVEFNGVVSTFPLQDRTLVNRLTFVADRGRIERVFYPVFPPDRDAQTVLQYLGERTPEGPGGRTARDP